MNEQGALTKGRVASTLLRFTLPVLGANALQTLYSLVDMLVVGQFADSAALSAVSVASLVFVTITSLAVGLTAGGTVCIGRRIGAGARERAGEIAQTMFTLYFLIALGFTVLFFALARPMLRLLNTPAEAMEQAVAYLQICTGGLLFTFGFNAEAAVLRADGDSRRPLLFVVVACAFNILGDLALVGGLHMGAPGAAIATMLGQGMSCAVGAVYLRKHNGLFDFRKSSFRLYGAHAAELLRVGVPMALQETLVMCSFMILEAVINRMGLTASAAAGVVDKLFTVGVIPSSAFAASIAAMVAQNMGAGRTDRVKQCLGIGLGVSFAVGLAVAFWLGFAPASAMRIFTRDNEVIAAGCVYLTWYVLEYPLCSLAFPMAGLINGCGHTRYTLLMSLLSTFAVRVPLVLLFCRFIPDAGLLHVGLALPFASLLQVIMGAAFCIGGRWKRPPKTIKKA